MNNDILLSEDKTVLCLDEARRMLHISKRKCAELLKDGVLLCTSTGKKTRQYRILRSDVEALLQTQDHTLCINNMLCRAYQRPIN